MVVGSKVGHEGGRSLVEVGDWPPPISEELKQRVWERKEAQLAKMGGSLTQEVAMKITQDRTLQREMEGTDEGSGRLLGMGGREGEHGAGERGGGEAYVKGGGGANVAGEGVLVDGVEHRAEAGHDTEGPGHPGALAEGAGGGAEGHRGAASRDDGGHDGGGE